MNKIEKVKLLKSDGSIILRPKSALTAALKRGLRLIPEIKDEPEQQVVSSDEILKSEFEFNINRSANVVINELRDLTSDQLSVVLTLEEGRKKPRKSVIKAIEKINE